MLTNKVFVKYAPSLRRVLCVHYNPDDTCDECKHPEDLLDINGQVVKRLQVEHKEFQVVPNQAIIRALNESQKSIGPTKHSNAKSPATKWAEAQWKEDHTLHLTMRHNNG